MKPGGEEETKDKEEPAIEGTISVEGGDAGPKEAEPADEDRAMKPGDEEETKGKEEPAIEGTISVEGGDAGPKEDEPTARDEHASNEEVAVDGIAPSEEPKIKNVS